MSNLYISPKTKKNKKLKFKKKYNLNFEDKRTKIKGGSPTVSKTDNPIKIENFTTNINKRLSFFPHGESNTLLNLDNIFNDNIMKIYEDTNKQNKPKIVSSGKILEEPKEPEEPEEPEEPKEPIEKLYTKKYEITRDLLNNIPISTNEKDQINKFKTESSLVYISIHGSVYSKDEKKIYCAVPQNTIICFLSPIDHSIAVTNEKVNYHLDEEIETLNEEKYLSLFKYGINLREEDLGKKKTSFLSKIDKKLFYNCLSDSNWYYPGDIYPNMYMALNEDDLKSNDNYGIEFYYFNKQEDKTVSNYPDKKFLNKTNLKKKIKENPKKEQEYILSDIVEYKTPDIGQKYKLLIIANCRPIIYDSQETVKNILLLDLFTYHINNDIINQLVMTKDKSSNVIQSVCNNIDDLSYYISVYTNIDIDSNKYKHSYNNNIFSKLPIIMNICDKIKNLPDLNNIHYEYLATLPFKILFLVFNYISDKYDKTKLEFFINNFIIKTIKILTYRQKKCFEYLLCLKSGSQNIPKLQELEDLRLIMFFIDNNNISKSFFLKKQFIHYSSDIPISNDTTQLVLTYDDFYLNYLNKYTTNKNILKVVIDGSLAETQVITALIDDIVDSFQKLKELILINFFNDQDICIKNNINNLVTLKLENTKIKIQRIDKIKSLKNLEYVRCKYSINKEYIFLYFLSKLNSLKIIDCCNIRQIILQCPKIKHLEIRNCNILNELNISASVDTLILSELNWQKDFIIITFNVTNIIFNYCYLLEEIFYKLLENKPGLFFKKPILVLELNYSFIRTKIQNDADESGLIDKKKFFLTKICKVKKKIQIEYSKFLPINAFGDLFTKLITWIKKNNNTKEIWSDKKNQKKLFINPK